MKLVTFHKEVIPLIITTILLGVLEFIGKTAWQKYVFWMFLIAIVVKAIIFLNGVIE